MPQVTITDKVANFRPYTTTPERRHNLYCFTTTKYSQESAVFFLLVEAFREKLQKRQALFIKDWFIKVPSDIPDDLSEGGYLAPMNISAKSRAAIVAETNVTLSLAGKTFKDKISRHGGGVRGFFSAVEQKFTTDTSLAGSSELFYEAQKQAVDMITDPAQGFGAFNPDNRYQPNGVFAKQTQMFKKHLTVNGFSPQDLGIY